MGYTTESSQEPYFVRKGPHSKCTASRLLATVLEDLGQVPLLLIGDDAFCTEDG